MAAGRWMSLRAMGEFLSSSMDIGHLGLYVNRSYQDYLGGRPTIIRTAPAVNQKAIRLAASACGSAARSTRQALPWLTVVHVHLGQVAVDAKVNHLDAADVAALHPAHTRHDFGLRTAETEVSRDHQLRVAGQVRVLRSGEGGDPEVPRTHHAASGSSLSASAYIFSSSATASGPSSLAVSISNGRP